MDKQCRISEWFSSEWFSSELEEDDLLYFCEDERKVVVYTVNTHDAMQDRIAALEKGRDHLQNKVCEMEKERNQLASQVYELEQERDQLKAQNAELVGQLTNAVNHLTRARRNYTNGLDEPIDSMNRAISRSPAAFLAEIQAKAIEDLITEFNANYYGEELSQWLEQQADKLRQQAQEPNS